MTTDEYYRHLGGLLGNLQSLELAIRAYLQNQSLSPEIGIPYGVDFYTIPVGSELPESAITDYASLGNLIDKINVIFNQNGKLKIDRSIVDIRDSLVHGRVSASGINDHIRIVKFTKPVEGKVKVIFNEVITEEWLILNKKRIFDAVCYIISNN